MAAGRPWPSGSVCCLPIGRALTMQGGITLGTPITFPGPLIGLPGIVLQFGDIVGAELGLHIQDWLARVVGHEKVPCNIVAARILLCKLAHWRRKESMRQWVNRPRSEGAYKPVTGRSRRRISPGTGDDRT